METTLSKDGVQQLKFEQALNNQEKMIGGRKKQQILNHEAKTKLSNQIKKVTQREASEPPPGITKINTVQQRQLQQQVQAEGAELASKMESQAYGEEADFNEHDYESSSMNIQAVSSQKQLDTQKARKQNLAKP